MHNQLTENTVDIVDLKDKLHQAITSMHNVQINIHKPDESNTEMPTIPPHDHPELQKVDLRCQDR